MRMGFVRPFVARDIPQVSELHARVFQTVPRWTPALRKAYESYLTCVFLDHAWQDARLPSLVYEDPSGDVMGFLGVAPRRMRLGNEWIQAAISSQFIVAPERRSTPAALALVKEFLSGPQDLSLSDEANHSTRKIWDCFGGSMAFLYGIHWVRLLRPARFLLRRMRTPRPLTAALAPLCWAADRISSILPGSPLRQDASELRDEDLGTETLLSCLSEASRPYALRPDYDVRSLGWLLQIISRRDDHGPLQKLVLRDRNDRIAGWYLYHANRGGLGEVLQIGARGDSAQAVLRHLFHHAAQRGVAVLRGRFEPVLLDELRQASCFFHDSGYRMVLHAKRPDLLDRIHRGEACLTRLEGEWCLRFSTGRWAAPSPG